MRSKLVIIPEPVDVDRFDPTAVKQDRSLGEFPMRSITGQDVDLEGRFKFLSVFKWEERKGWDLLLAAYIQQFSAADNTALVLLTNPFHTASDVSLRQSVKDFVDNELEKRGLPDPPAIFVLDSHIPDTQLPVLYRSVDCFVLPSRGEGNNNGAPLGI